MSDSLAALKLEGKTLTSNVAEAVTAAEVELTIDGAPTLTLALRDPHLKLLRSGMFGSRVTAQVDGHSFELVQVKKQGRQITTVFEDLAVAAMRRRKNPRKAAGGTVTRPQFAQALVAEDPWIKFRTMPGHTERAKVELARGKFPEPGQKVEVGDQEDTWEALGRLAGEVGWTRFTVRNDVWFVPEAFLILGTPTKIREHEGGVHDFDFDFDIGKPAATATVTVDIARWALPPGAVIQIGNMGPANGRWLVASVRRSLFSTRATVGLKRPDPTLPEPEPPPPPTSAELGPEGSSSSGSGAGKSVNTGSASAKGYVWPVRGRVSSGFGPRWGRLHAGVDISVGVGTPVGATKAGTVTFAGTAGGYGYAVYIEHDGGVVSRYGHLSKIQAARGQSVKAGQQIGLSGGAKGAPGAGNSRGPHLHFEIRPGNKPADPMRYLP